MDKPKSKKICIVVSSLGGGGAERSSALLSEILFDLGFEVHIVSVLNRIDYPYKGKLFNLGELKDKDDSVAGRLKRLLAFKRYLKQNNFDHIIDNRTRIGFLKELVISKWLYKSSKTVYCVRSYNTDLYINPKRTFGRFLYKNAYKIVSVSNAISDKLKQLYDFDNLQTIHNPTADTFKELDKDSINSDNYILFFGRLDDEVKNISMLIKAYSKSVLPSLHIKLKILGDGKDKTNLINKAEDLGFTEHIEFLGFLKNPYPIVENAYFTVLTSKYEGFPRVLVESLALGTPVVSVDCKSGPREIITQEHNGLLVENNNIEALVKAMNRMVEDKKLYLHCKENAAISVQKFSKASISKQWKALLN